MYCFFSCISDNNLSNKRKKSKMLTIYIKCGVKVFGHFKLLEMSTIILLKDVLRNNFYWLNISSIRVISISNYILYEGFWMRRKAWDNPQKNISANVFLTSQKQSRYSLLKKTKSIMNILSSMLFFEKILYIVDNSCGFS